MSQLFARKPIESLQPDSTAPYALKRVLGAGDLIMLAIGAVIGAGIRYGAGPALVFSFLLLGAACALAALCYAELAAMIPQAGSAYAYSYATLGELVAWIIGWDLILEYAVGNIAVAVSWAAYFRQLVLGFGIPIPAWMATDYRSARLAAQAVSDGGMGSLGPEMSVAYQAYQHHPLLLGIPIICN